MTLLDIIYLDKIWTEILYEITNFLSHQQKWARLWFEIYEIIKILKNSKSLNARK